MTKVVCGDGNTYVVNEAWYRQRILKLEAENDKLDGLNMALDLENKEQAKRIAELEEESVEQAKRINELENALFDIALKAGSYAESASTPEFQDFLHLETHAARLLGQPALRRIKKQRRT